MVNYLIEQSIKDRVIVLALTALLAIMGVWSFQNMPIDAIPDLSDVQVIVFTEYPGQAPQLVEDQVTYPLTTAMLSVPKTKVVRGYSFFGFSFIYIIFQEGTDIYWARSRVLEYLNFVSGRLPKDVNPTLGPDASGVGWIYEYALIDRTGQHDLAELRSIQDWYLRYPMQTVPGVSEVASIGGYIKQYQVEVDPNALFAYGITLDKVKHAIQRSNIEVGGRLIEMAETEYMVRGVGYIKSIDDINSIPLGVDDKGTPIRLQDVAHVHKGPELRRGLSELNGQGEVVGGIIVMRYGENARAIIERVRNKLQALSNSLPEGVEIVPVYDRGDLIERAIHTLNKALVQELIIVCLMVSLFLLHLRSSLVIAITLPLGVLIAFIVMRMQGLSANIMSLGGIAIAIGDMVDGSIVMVENAHKHLAEAKQKKQSKLTSEQQWQIISKSSKEVGANLFFSLLVITVSFVPIFVLEAQEGRMFSPLAYTKSYAMAAAALLTITVVPVLMGYLIRGNILPEQKNPLNHFLQFLHRPMLNQAMKWPKLTLLLVLGFLVSTVYPLSKIGSEFMPVLDEGDILYMPTTFPGISITKAKELLQQTDKILYTFPEVEQVFGKVGRANTATDSAPLSMIETTIKLKPKQQWPNPEKTTQDLMLEMDKAVNFPGLANSWTMPIKTRIDMLSTGIKTPVGIKVTGPNLNELQNITKAIEQAIKSMPETLSAYGDRAVGGYFLYFNINRQQAARYGLTIGDVQDIIQSAIGGINVTETVEGLERYPVSLRYPRELRDNLESLKRVLIPTPTGAQIPLSLVASLTLKRGPPSIKSENARLSAWVYIDIKTEDIGGFVEKAKQVLATKVKLPTGYIINWSGQFEYMERAEKQLQVVIPITLLLIFFLLYCSFKNLLEPFIVLLTIPFGLIGGIWMIYWYDFNLSVAVYVGFIALAGTAAETGAMVLNFIDIEIAKLRDQTRTRLTNVQITQAVQKATSLRVRPVAITAFTTMLGLFPVMWATGAGADVTQRIAAPVLGGMVTVLALSLLVFPVIYALALQILEKKNVGMSDKEVKSS